MGRGFRGVLQYFPLPLLFLPSQNFDFPNHLFCCQNLLKCCLAGQCKFSIVLCLFCLKVRKKIEKEKIIKQAMIIFSVFILYQLNQLFSSSVLFEFNFENKIKPLAIRKYPGKKKSENSSGRLNI